MSTANLDLNDKNLGRINPALKASQSVSPTNYSIFQTRDTMETFLKSVPGGSFTQTYLDTLTHNDIVFECRAKIGAAVNYQP